ncbi:hypothetical protein F2P81_003135 [Scophthalmus maximus]|uniref:Uncharacterized protein n=1 Tax=Scophthalmus maximus TaxID=52904 RepID=A0A6A4TBX8_SCOMX|nr:hypothetical protein F2P81_003135 [Scophthalmus maximus]
MAALNLRRPINPSVRHLRVSRQRVEGRRWTAPQPRRPRSNPQSHRGVWTRRGLRSDFFWGNSDKLSQESTTCVVICLMHTDQSDAMRSCLHENQCAELVASIQRGGRQRHRGLCVCMCVFKCPNVTLEDISAVDGNM